MTHLRRRETGCLACGNEQGGFESVEHVIPLALGNNLKSGLVEDELVLPPGATCDKCNGRRFSRADQALCNWPPVSVFRSLGQIRNRRRRLVDAVEGTRWNLRLDPRDRRNFQLDAVASTSATSGRDDVARALCKIALETRCLDDPVDARSARWDSVASAAIGGPLPRGLVMGLTQPEDIESVNFAPESKVLVDGPGWPLRMACEVWVVGLCLRLLLWTPPLRIPHTAWWTRNDLTGSLVGPNSMWASFRGRAAEAKPIASVPDSGKARDRLNLPTGAPGTHLQLTTSRAA